MILCSIVHLVLERLCSAGLPCMFKLATLQVQSYVDVFSHAMRPELRDKSYEQFPDQHYHSGLQKQWRIDPFAVHNNSGEHEENIDLRVQARACQFLQNGETAKRRW